LCGFHRLGGRHPQPTEATHEGSDLIVIELADLRDLVEETVGCDHQNINKAQKG
jgi:hypothetical protein